MTVRAVFLWHLHQPDYRDPRSGHPILPWVRLHACRAYNDMADALERHPGVRVVANWAPSLVLQLQHYVSGRARDLDEDLVLRSAEALSPAERAHVLHQSFSVDWELWVRPVGRYAELLDRRGADLRGVDLLQLQQSFSAQDLRDLQVHFMLAWMGFAARRDQPLVRALLAKGRGFAQQEAVELLSVQRRIAAGVIPRWQRLAARGQVEITCSPLYHPILPLLVDSDSARVAMPDATLPPRFRHPEDARAQVQRGRELVAAAFGAPVDGLWPSEGSVSPEVAELLVESGVRWCATDQGVLERSTLGAQTVAPAHGHAPHHRPLAAGPGGKLAMLFRDRELSDLIGFRYAHSEAPAAAADLILRLRGADRDLAAEDEVVVTLALDGENPWEHYPRSGELFLDALYARLQDPGSGVRTVLPRDELAQRAPRARIERLHSGSWIESSFRIWIGHPEDNQGWALLGAARDALEDARARGRTDPASLERAAESLYIAEGSDWFWWYGDDFTTENAAEFDALFRGRIEQAYLALSLPVPEAVGRPIIAPAKERGGSAPVLRPPRRPISPRLSGVSRAFYEWSGAGAYRPGDSAGSAMHRGRGVVEQLRFGFSSRELFLRLEPLPGASVPPALGLSFAAPGRPAIALAVDLAPGGDCPVHDAAGKKFGTARAGSLVEVAIELASLGLRPGDPFGLVLDLLRDGAQVERVPRASALELAVPQPGFERAYWTV